MAKNALIRSLRAALYNPRKITDAQLVALKKAMREYGDLSGIVVNRRTGHLVGGHQRVKGFDPAWPITSAPHPDPPVIVHPTAGHA